MYKRILSISMLLILAVMVVSGCGSDNTKGEGSDEKIVLKFADYFPDTHFMSVNGTQAWMEKVEELTDGQVEIKHYPGEQLGKGADTLDLVKTGAADMGNVSQGYVSGSMPLSSVVSLPGLMDSIYQVSMASYEVVSSSPVLEEDFLSNDVRPIFAYGSSSYEFWTTKDPIKRVSDLKGKKIRTSGGAANKHIESLGAVPASISAPEQYEALERNTIDGTLFTIDSIPSYNLNEVVNYSTVGAGGGPNLGMIFINEDVWSSLPEDVQDSMLEATDIVLEELGEKVEEQSEKTLEEYESNGEIEFIEVDEEEFKEAASPVIDDWVKTNEARGLPAEETLNIYKEALEKYKE